MTRKIYFILLGVAVGMAATGSYFVLEWLLAGQPDLVRWRV